MFQKQTIKFKKNPIKVFSQNFLDFDKNWIKVTGAEKGPLDFELEASSPNFYALNVEGDLEALRGESVTIECIPDGIYNYNKLGHVLMKDLSVAVDHSLKAPHTIEKQRPEDLRDFGPIDISYTPEACQAYIGSDNDISALARANFIAKNSQYYPAGKWITAIFGNFFIMTERVFKPYVLNYMGEELTTHSFAGDRIFEVITDQAIGNFLVCSKAED